VAAVAGSSEPSILKNVLIIAPLSLIGRAGTFLIYIVLANRFGDTAEMDFIYYYWGVAVFLIELLSAASAYSVLVPLLAEARAKGETEAQRCIQSVFSLYITTMPVLCCLLVSISYAVSQLFFPNAGLVSSTTVGIVCGFLIFAIISAIRWMLKAVLDTYQAFQPPIIVQGIRAAFVIGAIYLFQPFLAWFSIPLALILGELCQVLILVPRCCAMLSLRVRDLAVFKIRGWQETQYTKSFLRQCLLMMGAAISDGLNPVVDRGMGSTLGASSVSKLDYALRLCAIPEALTGVTLPILLSHWAKISASKSDSENAQHLQRSVWQGVIALLVLMVPFLVVFYLFRSDIVAMLYGHGKLSEVGQTHIASLIGIYLIGMLPRLISRLLIRAHLARQAHRTVLTATLIRLILNPLLNWFFMLYWGLEGIAWSTALLSYPILAYIAIAFWQQKGKFKDANRKSQISNRDEHRSRL